MHITIINILIFIITTAVVIIISIIIIIIITVAVITISIIMVFVKSDLLQFIVFVNSVWWIC